MKHKVGSNRVGYVVLAALAFVGGRWSVETPTTETNPQYLVAPTSQVPAEQAGADAVRTDAISTQATSERMTKHGRDEGLTDRFEETANSGFTCEGKRYCREMNSCDEANFYLNQCGVGRLDGDGDGIPCESIC